MVEGLVHSPMSGIANGDFFKSYAVYPVGCAHVQMSGYDGARTILCVPIFGVCCSAPRNEPWDIVESHQIRAQRKVVDKYGICGFG